MPDNPTTSADWYADPADPTLHRWWDGTGWTDRLRPAAPLRAVGPTRRARSAVAERPEPRELPAAGLSTTGTLEPPPRAQRARALREEIVPPRPATAESNNRVATVAVLIGIIVTVGFAVAQFFELPLTFLFAPSLVAVATAALAFDRARRTGAGIVSSTIALVVAVPLPAIAIWSFSAELSALVL
jgi:hypothetical protein